MFLPSALSCFCIDIRSNNRIQFMSVYPMPKMKTLTGSGLSPAIFSSVLKFHFETWIKRPRLLKNKTQNMQRQDMKDINLLSISCNWLWTNGVMRYTSFRQKPNNKIHLDVDLRSSTKYRHLYKKQGSIHTDTLSVESYIYNIRNKYFICMHVTCICKYMVLFNKCQEKHQTVL